MKYEQSKAEWAEERRDKRRAEQHAEKMEKRREIAAREAEAQRIAREKNVTIFLKEIFGGTGTH